MTANTKENVISVSQGTAFAGGICAFVSISERSASASIRYAIFSWLL